MSRGLVSAARPRIKLWKGLKNGGKGVKERGFHEGSTFLTG